MAARFVAVGAFMAAAVQAVPYGSNGTTVTTTEVVETLTTYCPGPTTLTYGDKTYTVTEATTLTITDCPCTLTHPVHPATTTIAPPQDACAKKCGDEYNSCRTAADANMSYCAAMYAKCLGFNPFEEGSLVTPTACSAQPEHTVYTTEVVQSYTTYCPYATDIVHGNKTIHVTEPGTVTVTDCPCTISKPMPQPTGPAAPPANPSTPAQPEQPEQPEGCNGSDCPESTTVQVQPSVPAVVTPGSSDVPASAGRVVPGALIALGALALF
jgi:hypothetical protein